MNVKTFVVPAEHFDDTALGYKTIVRNVLAFEFFDGQSGDRMCRLVCEVK